MRSNKIMQMLNQLLQLITRLAGANLLFLLYTFPVVISVGVFWRSTAPNEAIFNIVVVAAFLPVFLFPALLAMFALIREWVIGREVSHVFRFYWRQYRGNYGSGLVLGLLFTLIWGAFIIDYYAVIQHAPVGFVYLLLALFVYLLPFTAYVFCNIVHFQISKMNALKNAILMTIKHPFLSMFTSFVSILVVLASLSSFVGLFLFFTFSIVAYMMFKSFHRIVAKLVRVAS